MTENQEVPIDSWSQLQVYDKGGRWLFRGQQDCSWELATSLQRCLVSHSITPAKRSAIENGLIREFRRACHQYTNHVPHTDHVVETLALMQHYGAPTRLLDVTYSIHIATYFALEGLLSHDPDTHAAAVWCIRGDWAYSESANRLEAAGRSRKVVRSHVTNYRFDEGRETLNRKLFFRGEPVRLVAPINTYRLNERLRTQKGIFLIPGDIGLSFKENLEAMPGFDDPRNIVKLIIPTCVRNKFLKKLYDMNISRTSLFPGLDGFARSLGVYTHAYKAGPWIKKRNGVWRCRKH